MKVYKSIQNSIKDIDNKQVAFYFARYNVVDLHGDVIEKGAFHYDITMVKHFLNHDITQLIGKIERIEDDNTGIFAVSKLLDTTLGKDIQVMYIEQAINQHSFMGYVESSQWNNDGTCCLKKINLMEVSSLTHWAAQPDTPVKKQLLKNKIEELFILEYLKKIKF